MLACRQAGVSLDDQAAERSTTTCAAAEADPARGRRRRRGAVQPRWSRPRLPADCCDPGSISYIYYADRLNQLPLGLIGIGLGTVLLPTISRPARPKRDAEAMDTQNRGLELALFLTLPATIALVICGGADHPRAVPARPVRLRSTALRLQLGARRFLARAAVLRPREGADPRLLRAARHQDAGALRDYVDRREPCRQSHPDPDPGRSATAMSGRRSRPRSPRRVNVWMLYHTLKKRGHFESRRAASAPSSAPGHRRAADGRGAVLRRAAGRSLSHRLAPSTRARAWSRSSARRRGLCASPAS